jgi:hypothetical protein
MHQLMRFDWKMHHFGAPHWCVRDSVHFVPRHRRYRTSRPDGVQSYALQHCRGEHRGLILLQGADKFAMQ